MLITPLAHLDAISLPDANASLVQWQHRMGAVNRPMGFVASHGLFHHGKLCSVAVSAALIRETAGGFSRNQAFELARLCACRPDLCRVMLRLWREMVFPAICATRGYEWAISYQDEALHSGNSYRFDGWVRVQEHARSGTDQRSGRVGRTKTVWAWHPDRAERRRVEMGGGE